LTSRLCFSATRTSVSDCLASRRDCGWSRFRFPSAPHRAAPRHIAPRRVTLSRIASAREPWRAAPDPCSRICASAQARRPSSTATSTTSSGKPAWFVEAAVQRAFARALTREGSPVCADNWRVLCDEAVPCQRSHIQPGHLGHGWGGEVRLADQFLLPKCARGLCARVRLVRSSLLLTLGSLPSPYASMCVGSGLLRHNELRDISGTAKVGGQGSVGGGAELCPHHCGQ
jgi:hypothetical protein